MGGDVRPEGMCATPGGVLMSPGRTIHGRDLPPTSWTLLEAMRVQGPNHPAAQEEFARRYYQPVREFLSALGCDAHTSEELTQAFFANRVLDGPLVARADRSLGSFRCYLRRAVRNFHIDWLRRESKRRRHAHPGDSEMTLAGIPDPQPEAMPDRAFHLAWVRALLERVLVTLELESRARSQEAHFQIFVDRFLPETLPAASWASLGARHGLDEKAARGRAETIIRRFRALLRAELSRECIGRVGVDEELLALRLVLEGNE